MSYLQAMAAGYSGPSKPKYTPDQINWAKKMIRHLEDKDLLVALNVDHLFYLVADEDFWQERSVKKGLYNKPSNITWKRYYLSQFV
jgi:hypothetical protein